MPPKEPGKIYHGSRYNPDSACGHCGGFLRHEPWCATRNAAVAYAFAAALEVQPLSEEDQLLLHALGVSWPTTAAPVKS